jgi:hypothetical protein
MRSSGHPLVRRRSRRPPMCWPRATAAAAPSGTRATKDAIAPRIPIFTLIVPSSRLASSSVACLRDASRVLPQSRDYPLVASDHGGSLLLSSTGRDGGVAGGSLRTALGKFASRTNSCAVGQAGRGLSCGPPGNCRTSCLGRHAPASRTDCLGSVHRRWSELRFRPGLRRLRQREATRFHPSAANRPQAR